MNLENIGGFSLMGIDRRNVILGKNGCGKSYLLKQLESTLHNNGQYGLVRYITPERAGFVEYQPNVDQNISSSPGWLQDVRRKNQSDTFKQQSVVLYRLMEMLCLREIDSNRSLPPFSNTIDRINTLLDRVKISPHGTAFQIIDRTTETPASAQTISSGEAELISLAIEMLAFDKQRDKEKMSLLLIDEPDVHLHPDLQHRLAKFIVDTFTDDKATIIVATHSTALLSALASDSHSRVAFMKRGDTSLSFVRVTKAYRELLPIFGAHPLSNVFAEKPILIVEGEDDERIWQQAVRSGEGTINVYPCPVDGNSQLAEYEQDADRILSAIYDTASGFSLRDRDTDSEDIDDFGRIVRIRLACRAAENLLLTDDVLALAETDWPTIEAAVRGWIEDAKNNQHRYYGQMSHFVEGGLNRMDFDLKEIRNILLGMISDKPWEVLVGRAIAKLKQGAALDGPNSLRIYLGPKLCEKLLSMAAT